MKVDRGLDVVVVAADAPEDRHHGFHLRRWWLLGGGQARVVCLRRRVRGVDGSPLRDRLPWLEITEIAPQSACYPPSQHLARMLIETALRKAGKDTVLLLSNPPTLVQFVDKQVKVPLVVDLCDSMALFSWRRAKALKHHDPLRTGINVLHALRWLHREAMILRRADISIVSSPVDAACVRRFAPNRRVRVIGNGTDWLQRDILGDRACQRARLVFHGALQWYPNSSALEYFALAHWPRIRAQVPGVEFHVAGHSMPDRLRQLCAREGVVVHGFVDDIFELVATSGLYVAPMVSGSGVKNKLMEAMAAGVPVVTNKLGAEALPPEARRVVAIHDRPQAFADHVQHVVSDPARWSELRRQTRLAAERCFDWQHRRAEFVNLVAEAVTASETDIQTTTA